jgi:hypothetical protein
VTTRLLATACGKPYQLVLAIPACRGQLAGGKSQHTAIRRASPLDQVRSSSAVRGNACPNVRGQLEDVLSWSCFFRRSAIMSGNLPDRDDLTFGCRSSLVALLPAPLRHGADRIPRSHNLRPASGGRNYREFVAVVFLDYRREEHLGQLDRAKLGFICKEFIKIPYWLLVTPSPFIQTRQRPVLRSRLGV